MSGAHARSFNYDSRGNVTSNGARSFTYNRANRLTSSGGITYQYDGHGLRVSKTQGGTKTYSLYNQQGTLLATYRNGNYVEYYHLGQQLVARYNDAPQQADGLGYTGHLEDDDLELTYMQQRYYDPLIGRFYSNDPVDFLGHMRRGNPTMGFNRYAYANNNPYKYTDPDGRFAFVIPAIPYVVKGAVTARNAYTGYRAVRAVQNIVQVAEAASDVRGENGRSTDNPVDLAEDLAGQEILGDFSEGGGKNMSDKMGDTNRYGPNGTHDKVVGSKTHSDGTKTEVHGDRNRETGELSDTKFKDPPDNSKSRNQ